MACEPITKGMVISKYARLSEMLGVPALTEYEENATGLYLDMENRGRFIFRWYENGKESQPFGSKWYTAREAWECMDYAEATIRFLRDRFGFTRKYPRPIPPGHTRVLVDSPRFGREELVLGERQLELLQRHHKPDTTITVLPPPKPVRECIRPVMDQQGWNDHGLLPMLLNFIDEMGVGEELGAFLEEVAAEENEH